MRSEMAAVSCAGSGALVTGSSTNFNVLTSWRKRVSYVPGGSISTELSERTLMIFHTESDRSGMTLSPTCGIGGGEGGASGKVGCAAFLRAFAMVETA
jgi:hypothetical protein